ncbi:MAG: hypothetical protein EOQ42_36235, partial [Mesorhizobium sp.]
MSTGRYSSPASAGKRRRSRSGGEGGDAYLPLVSLARRCGHARGFPFRCQSLGPGGLVSSNAPADISGPAASSIAGDMVSRLAEHVGPGSGTIALRQDGTPFGQALESALKGSGYAVVTDQKTDSGTTIVPLAYVVEPFEGQVLARLSTSGVELGRA